MKLTAVSRVLSMPELLSYTFALVIDGDGYMSDRRAGHGRYLLSISSDAAWRTQPTSSRSLALYVSWSMVEEAPNIPNYGSFTIPYLDGSMSLKSRTS